DPDDPDRRLMANAKINVAAKGKALGFRVAQRLVGPEEDILASHIVWENETFDTTADELVAASEQGGRSETATDEAQEFLETILANGPVDVAEIETQARAAGILGKDQRLGQSKPIRKARQKLAVESGHRGFGSDSVYTLALKAA